MANPEHLEILKQGVKVWNDWAEIKRGVADLSSANLEHAELQEFNLRFSNLSGANLRWANLDHVLLAGANLSKANLGGAYLGAAELSGANLREASLIGARLELSTSHNADFTDADLGRANLRESLIGGSRFVRADLSATAFDAAWLDNSDFRHSKMIFTSFGHVDLSKARGLDAVRHYGPSFVGIDTLFMSEGKIPEIFLYGCGVPESFIVQIPALIESVEPIQFYKCFISFTEADDFLSERLYNDLRGKGVTCWRWKEDAKWGKTLMRSIDEAVRVYDKLIVICSEQSLNSPAVIREIERALQKEDELLRQGKDAEVLFPIRLDDYIFTGWNHYRKADVIAKNIGDFRMWNDPERYKKAFDRLLRDLKASE